MAVEQVTVDNFYSWLQNKTQNTVDTPYAVKITGLTENNQSNVVIALQNVVDKYIDLSPTAFPMPVSFYGIQALVYPPSFISFSTAPSVSWFGNCSNLKASPVFSNSVTNFNYMFKNCTSLEVFTVGSIDINTIDYSHIFEGCTNLTTFICDNPDEVKQWLTAIKNESTDNFPNDPDNCHYIPYSTAEIPFSLLNDYLSSLPANTASTPYSINVTELTVYDIESSGTSGTLGNVIKTNSTKYVDLSETTLPNGITTMLLCFEDCTSLTTAPNLPNSVTSMQLCFWGCTSLTTVPNLPNGVTNMSGCFEDCTSLTTVPNIPNNVTNMTSCFYGCTSLTTAPSLPNGVIDMTTCFYECTSLTTVPNIPNSVTSMSFCFYRCTSLTTAPNIPNDVIDMSGCFYGCTSITTAPNIPNSVTSMSFCFYRCTSLTTAPNIPNDVIDMSGCFYGCTSITTAPNIPDSVTDMNRCFYGCSSLEEITLFEVDLESLVTNNKAEKVFSGCTSLTKIGVPSEPPVESDWHAFRLKFGASTVEGKVYDKTGTAVTIPQTSVTKSTLKLPIKTDELWFPSGYTDAQIDALIEKVIQYRYTYWNKTVLDPAQKNFVLWADNPSNVNSNLKGMNPVDVIQSGNMNPVTSNAVANSNAMPVNSVTSGNMHSVTANAVANSLGTTTRYLIPLCTTLQTTSGTEWAQYLWLGAYYKTFFNSLPTISGKTKKMRIVLGVQTNGNIGITVGVKRDGDTNYTYICENYVVWGGVGANAYADFIYKELDPSFIDSRTTFYMKSNTVNGYVAIAFMFAEVFYE